MSTTLSTDRATHRRNRIARHEIDQLSSLAEKAVVLADRREQHGDEWCRLVLSDAVYQHMCAHTRDSTVRDDAYHGLDAAIRNGSFDWDLARSIYGYIATAVRNARLAGFRRRDVLLHDPERLEQLVPVLDLDVDLDERPEFVAVVERIEERPIGKNLLAGHLFRLSDAEQEVLRPAAITERQARRARRYAAQLDVAEAAKEALRGVLDPVLDANLFPMLRTTRLKPCKCAAACECAPEPPPCPPRHRQIILVDLAGRSKADDLAGRQPSAERVHSWMTVYDRDNAVGSPHFRRGGRQRRSSADD